MTINPFLSCTRWSGMKDTVYRMLRSSWGYRRSSWDCCSVSSADWESAFFSILYVPGMRDPISSFRAFEGELVAEGIASRYYPIRILVILRNILENCVDEMSRGVCRLHVTGQLNIAVFLFRNLALSELKQEFRIRQCCEINKWMFLQRFKSHILHEL